MYKIDICIGFHLVLFNISMKKIHLYIIIIYTLFTLPLNAVRNDSIQFSLLTCSPGTEIYALFGHTAIRYQNFTKDRDIVFNYGMFSFSAPNFIYRFVKGETDYMLGINTFEAFRAEYLFRGSSVYQQILNLNQNEKLKLEELLFTNYQPENRVYRYNYFYDNCTTRARDQIEKSIEGKVEYQALSDSIRSFRGIVHEFTKGFQWEEFGIDLCLGAEADGHIDIRQQMFSPFYMRDFANSACIVNDKGESRPLVLKEEIVVDADPDSEMAEPAFPLSPLQCAVIFLMVNIIVAYFQIMKKKIFWFYDLLLYIVQGVAGCIIAFLFFVSVHPTVGSNWMILLLNPIPLFYLPFMIYNGVKMKKDWYHIINAVYLTFFIVLFPVIPQEFNFSVLPLSAGLLVNAVSHVIVYKKLQ